MEKERNYEKQVIYFGGDRDLPHLRSGACGPEAATVAPATEAPVTVEPTAAPTVPPTAVPICLTIGVTYGGPVNDGGYNQAMRDSILAIKEAIPCVKILSAENVYDEAGAITSMEQMIKFGATLIFATASTHQNASVALAAKYPKVKFENAGGWLMGDNYANYYGNPPQGWYLMGIAAGMMTKTNKLGFVAAFPLGWTLTFVNAFELGAQSVNPAVQTEVKFTFDWASQAKEADATNALINDGADVVTMHVDAPGPIISTAESRGIYSIGFQSLAAQQFAPELLDWWSRVHPGSQINLANLHRAGWNLEAHIPALRDQRWLYGTCSLGSQSAPGSEG